MRLDMISPPSPPSGVGIPLEALLVAHDLWMPRTGFTNSQEGAESAQ